MGLFVRPAITATLALTVLSGALIQVPAAHAAAGDYIAMTFDTTLSDDDSTIITVPNPAGFQINWGDGTTNFDDSHTYASPGTYAVRVDFVQSGVTTAPPQLQCTSGSCLDALISVDSWAYVSGTPITGPMFTFTGARNLVTVPATVDPGMLTGDASDLFSDAASLDSDVTAWDVSQVTRADRMFQDAHLFDEDLSSWDVSGWTSAEHIFEHSGMSQENIEATLIGWEAQPVQMNVDLGNITQFLTPDGLNATTSLQLGSGWTVTHWGLVGANAPSDDFTFTIDTRLNPGAPVTVFTWAKAYTIDWGDGNVNTDDVHTYATDGVYQVRVLLGGPVSQSTRLCPASVDGAICSEVLISVDDWGLWAPTTWEYLFRGAQHLTSVPVMSPPLPASPPVTMSARLAFSGATAFNGDISNWDTSRISEMTAMFSGAASFNQDISGWNTANVRGLAGIFERATSFNQPIGSWNVSQVSAFWSTFKGATSFNQDLSSWNTRLADNASGMFDGAVSFNQDISAWDTSRLRVMASMFKGATSFNQDISSWNTAAATNMLSMFQNASSFDQDLAAWNVTAVTNMNGMFDGSGLSENAYAATLNGWAAQPVRTLVAVGNVPAFRRASAEAAYTTLTGAKTWTITDQGPISDADYTNMHLVDTYSSLADTENANTQGTTNTAQAESYAAVAEQAVLDAQAAYDAITDPAVQATVAAALAQAVADASEARQRVTDLTSRDVVVTSANDAATELAAALAAGTKADAEAAATRAEADAAAAQAAYDAITDPAVQALAAADLAQALADADAARVHANSMPNPTPPTPPTPPVVYPPGAPIDVVATSSNSTVTVRWNPPTTTGSFPVTNYQVSVSDGQTCLTATLECTFTGLDLSVTYTFTVRALNGAGWGSWSAPVDVIFPLNPPPAGNIAITSWEMTKRKVVVTGTAVDLPAGTTLTPMIKLRGQTSYRPGTAVIRIAEDGTFTWKRCVKKKLYVYFTAPEGVRSSRVIVSR